MNLAEAIRGVHRLFLDTAPIIYYLERHPVYFDRMEAFFRLRSERNTTIVTSPVTLAECLVHPIRRRLLNLEDDYRRLILGGVNTEFHDIGPQAALKAAYLRASFSISLMDAFQIAVAFTSGCQSMLTNDRRLAKIKDIPILILDELEI